MITSAVGYGSPAAQTGSLHLLGPLSHGLSDWRIGRRPQILLQAGAASRLPNSPLHSSLPLPISTASSYLEKVWRRPAFVYAGEYPRLDLHIPGLHKQDHTWFGIPNGKKTMLDVAVVP